MISLNEPTHEYAAVKVNTVTKTYGTQQNNGICNKVSKVTHEKSVRQKNNLKLHIFYV